jgi:signal-transduction protein with cAMP-binding, CBS, and nucleotidyltransferase domain
MIMKTFKKAKEIASDKLFFIDGLASVRDAIQLMKEKNVRALIIRKRNSADANGIITVNGIIKGIILLDKTIDEVSVYEIMTKPVFSISAHLNVKYVPRLMHNYDIKIAPVEENGEYIGIIDYAQFLFTELLPENNK